MKRGVFLLICAVILMLMIQYVEYRNIELELQHRDQIAEQAQIFCLEIAEAFEDANIDRICAFLADGCAINAIESYTKLNLEFDAIQKTGRSWRYADEESCLCVIRYHLISDIPEELDDSISYIEHQERGNFIFQTISFWLDTNDNCWYYCLIGYDMYSFSGDGLISPTYSISGKE